jgi:hypothetical protein
MTTPVQGPQQNNEARPKWIDLALEASQKVWKQFSAKSGISMEALGPAAKKVADEMYKTFEAAAKQDGSVKSELILEAFQLLRSAHSKDNLAKFDPGPPPDAKKQTDGAIQTDPKYIKETAGRFALVGLHGPDHLLTQLMQRAGLNPASFSPAAREVLTEFSQSPKWSNLTDPVVWRDLGKKLREVAVAEGADGGPRAADVQRAVKNAQAVLQRPVENGAKADLGLAKNAGTTSNTGSASSATAVRAQLLSGLKSKNADADQAASTLTDAILKGLKIDDVSKSVRSDIVSTIKDALKDPSSPDGSVRPSEVLVNAFRALVGRVPDGQPKASFQLGLELAEVLSQATRGAPLTAGLEKAFSEMALGALSDLVSTILGKTPQGVSEPSKAKMIGILTQLGKKSSIAKTYAKAIGAEPPKVEKKKAETPPKTEKAQATPPKNDGLDETRELVRSLLQSIGMTNFDDPRSKALEQAFIEIHSKGHDSASVATNALKWVNEKSGGLVAAWVKQAEEIAPQLEAAVKAATMQLGQLREDHASYKKQLETTTDPEARGLVEGSLKSAERAITETERALKQNKEALKQGRDNALGMVAQFVLHEEEFRRDYGPERNAPHGPGGGGGGGPEGPHGPGGGGGGDGGDGGGGGGRVDGGGNGGRGGEPNWFRRDPVDRAGLPGIFSGGRPDDDPDKMTLQQQRAVKCAEVHQDPSLSIEDKIFLFMMWFVAFTDREREKQLEEIVGLDRDQARRAQAIDKKRQEEKSQRMEGSKAAEELRGAEKERDALKAGGDESPALAAANKKVEEAESKVRACRGRIDEIQSDINRLRRDSDKAPQSREVKFTELQRLSQLRDNILNMARSIMETSNRNIEKVFR